MQLPDGDRNSGVITMRARELMNRFFITLSPTDPVRDAVEAMVHERVGVVCVCDPLGRPVGVVTDRDVVTRGCYKRLPLDREPVGSVMTPNPLICGPEDDMDEVELQMERRGVGRVLVADEGKLVGLITLAEIWHSESPMKAGAISRRVTERELRVGATGGHYDGGRSSRRAPPS